MFLLKTVHVYIYIYVMGKHMYYMYVNMLPKGLDIPKDYCQFAQHYMH